MNQNTFPIQKPEVLHYQLIKIEYLLSRLGRVLGLNLEKPTLSQETVSLLIEFHMMNLMRREVMKFKRNKFRTPVFS